MNEMLSMLVTVLVLAAVVGGWSRALAYVADHDGGERETEPELEDDDLGTGALALLRALLLLGH